MNFLYPNLVMSLSFIKPLLTLQCVQGKSLCFQHRLTKSFTSRILSPQHTSIIILLFLKMYNHISLHTLFLKSASFFISTYAVSLCAFRRLLPNPKDLVHIFFPKERTVRSLEAGQIPSIFGLPQQLELHIIY